MKKALTRGEKWLFASPLLFLVITGAAWQWRKTVPRSIELPKARVVNMLEFSPDGRRLVVFSNDTLQKDSPVGEIYEVDSGEKVCELTAPPVIALQMAGSMRIAQGYSRPAWSPDGTRIASRASAVFSSGLSFFATSKGIETVVIWDAKRGNLAVKYLSKTPNKSRPSGEIHFSSDGKTLVEEGMAPTIYDAATNKTITQPSLNIGKEMPTQSNVGLGLSVFVDSDNGVFKVVDVGTKQVVWKPKLNHYKSFDWAGGILCVKDSTNPNQDDDSIGNRLLLWNAGTRQKLNSPHLPSGAEIGEFTVHPDTGALAYVQLKPNSQGFSSELVVWDCRANRELWRYAKNTKFWRLDWSPDGKWLTAINAEANEYRLSVFDQSGKLNSEYAPVGFFTRWSPDSQKLITVVGETKDSAPRLEIHRFED